MTRNRVVHPIQKQRSTADDFMELKDALKSWDLGGAWRALHTDLQVVGAKDPGKCHPATETKQRRIDIVGE